MSVSNFTVATFAYHYNPYDYHDADPESDYAKLHAQAIANGQCFSPNGGQSWFVVINFKTPYHCTYRCHAWAPYID